MKTLDAGLQAHLDSGATTLCWCWRIVRSDGATFGFTNTNVALNFDGTDFEPDSGFDAAELREASDLSVDAQEAHGVLTSDLITETDLLDGLWDGAVVEIWRVNRTDTTQRVILRVGTLGQVRRGRTDFVAELRSLAHELNQAIGRSFQKRCDAKLGDARCTVDLDSPAFKGSGTVGAALRDRAFTTTDLASYAAGLFTLGRVSWLTGANAGRVARVGWHALDGSTATLTLTDAPLLAIEAGDTFTITAGCDKLVSTCTNTFSNTVNFRGFPHIPGNDAVQRYAGSGGGGNTGEPL